MILIIEVYNTRSVFVLVQTFSCSKMFCLIMLKIFQKQIKGAWDSNVQNTGQQCLRLNCLKIHNSNSQLFLVKAIVSCKGSYGIGAEKKKSVIFYALFKGSNHRKDV